VRQSWSRYRTDRSRRLPDLSSSAGRSTIGRSNAYAIYLLVEMRLSHQKIADHLATVFKLPVPKSAVLARKRETARKLEPMHRLLLRKIASGSLVHVTRRRASFMAEVIMRGYLLTWQLAYVYSASRETSMFKGVLISN
jgi:hypothetical protein